MIFWIRRVLVGSGAWMSTLTRSVHLAIAAAVCTARTRLVFFIVLVPVLLLQDYFHRSSLAKTLLELVGYSQYTWILGNLIWKLLCRVSKIVVRAKIGGGRFDKIRPNSAEFGKNRPKFGRNHPKTPFGIVKVAFTEYRPIWPINRPIWPIYRRLLSGFRFGFLI